MRILNATEKRDGLLLLAKNVASRPWCARPPPPCPWRHARASARVVGVGCVSIALVACHSSLIHGSTDPSSHTMRAKQQHIQRLGEHQPRCCPPRPEHARKRETGRRGCRPASKTTGAARVACVKQSRLSRNVEKCREMSRRPRRPPPPPQGLEPGTSRRVGGRRTHATRRRSKSAATGTHRLI